MFKHVPLFAVALVLHSVIGQPVGELQRPSLATHPGSSAHNSFGSQPSLPTAALNHAVSSQDTSAVWLSDQDLQLAALSDTHPMLTMAEVCMHAPVANAWSTSARQCPLDSNSALAASLAKAFSLDDTLSPAFEVCNVRMDESVYARCGNNMPHTQAKLETHIVSSVHDLSALESQGILSNAQLQRVTSYAQQHQTFLQANKTWLVATLGPIYCVLNYLQGPPWSSPITKLGTLICIGLGVSGFVKFMGTIQPGSSQGQDMSKWDMANMLAITQ
ncbi:hypothetical protein H4R34_003885 [Dimargaris verticillata]|uniref:Uncharacterized protein n=1 Tax=Dimargaris verticillata TaxID=2761393 RepID=A0A9W8B6N4_9FUNG|nr:hypothetical protein H4R34_003885 [Dimargaris verticillata]